MRSTPHGQNATRAEQADTKGTDLISGEVRRVDVEAADRRCSRSAPAYAGVRIGHVLKNNRRERAACCDSLAFIGRNPGDTNIYIVTGDSGNGMTHGTIAGMLLTDLIQGWQMSGLLCMIPRASR